MTKLERIELEAQKAREKIAAMQSRLKEIDGQRTEQENLQIVQQVRALKLSREELYAFIHGGALPGALSGAVDGNTAETETTAAPEPVYSRHRNRRHEPDSGNEPEEVTPEGENPTNTFESEEMSHEE
jgi:Mg-chelatase subunit ChlI